ncbi:Transcriptional regulator, MerR family protein [Minicystis rosea]|nr:Transcriptional regulator, MerR family protein [Minicystis rosea]
MSDDDLTIEELAREADILPRAVRYYFQRKMLPKPPFKSRNTRYGRAHLVRLRAIVKLRKGGMLLDAIRKKLAGMTEDELLELAGMAPPPVDHAASEPSTPVTVEATPPPPQARPLPEGFHGPYRAALVRPSDRWEHIAICPGVVLMVRGDADAEAWRVAGEIVATFGGEA